MVIITISIITDRFDDELHAYVVRKFMPKHLIPRSTSPPIHYQENECSSKNIPRFIDNTTMYDEVNI